MDSPKYSLDLNAITESVPFDYLQSNSSVFLEDNGSTEATHLLDTYVRLLNNTEENIFSDLPFEFFHDFENEQMSSFLSSFRNYYLSRIQQTQNRPVVPKFKFTVNEENAYLIQLTYSWAQGNVLLYFSFEKDKSDSSFGMIWNDLEKHNYESRSGNLSLNKTEDIIHEVTDFIFKVF